MAYFRRRFRPVRRQVFRPRFRRKKLPLVAARSRRRRWRQKRLNKGNNFIPSAIAGGESGYSYRSRAKPKLNRMIGNNYYFVVNTGRVVATPGLQTSFSMTCLDGGADGGGSQLDAIRALIQTAAGTRKTTNYCIPTISERLYLTNNSNGTAEVIIYDIYTRRNSASGPGTMWVQGMTDMQGGVATITNQTVGCVPFMSIDFNKFFKVYRTKRVILAGGQSHIHNRYQKKPVYVDMAEIANSGCINFKGITHHTLVVAYGMPANDTTTKTQVSTQQVIIDYIYRQTYTYKWVADTTDNMYSLGTLPNGYTVNQSLIEPANDGLTVGAIVA